MFGTICSQGLKGQINLNIWRWSDLVSAADLCMVTARNIVTSKIRTLKVYFYVHYVSVATIDAGAIRRTLFAFECSKMENKIN